MAEEKITEEVTTLEEQTTMRKMILLRQPHDKFVCAKCA